MGCLHRGARQEADLNKRRKEKEIREKRGGKREPSVRQELCVKMGPIEGKPGGFREIGEEIKKRVNRRKIKVHDQGPTCGETS